MRALGLFRILFGVILCADVVRRMRQLRWPAPSERRTSPRSHLLRHHERTPGAEREDTERRLPAAPPRRGRASPSAAECIDSTESMH